MPTQYKKNPNEDTAYFDGHKVNLIAVPAGTLQLPIHPTSDSGYVVDNNGKKHRVLMATFISGTVDYKSSPTADSAYVTINGQKVKVRLAVKENGTLTLSDKPNVDKGYVVGDDSEKHRVTLINTPTGTLELPNNETDDSAYIIDGNGNKIKVRMFALLSGGYVEVTVKGVSPLSLPDAIADSLSYVKAFGGTEQRNIPQPYTQVNYVTNTAQTAVDTGIMIDFAKNYEFEVECRAVSGSWYILQSRASSSGNITGIHGATSGSTITLVVGNVTVCTSAITRTVGNKLYVKATLNAGTATLYVKDETANTEDTQTGSYGTSQPNPTASVYLLGNAGGQYVDVNSDIYMARIKENDTVVMDYVPARQVATAGFYDTVSGTFKTAETPANLSADGNTVPSPDAPMDIISNNGVLKARHQSGLPLGYTLLDYIESSGTQYIDTGITPTSNEFKVQTKIVPLTFEQSANMILGTTTTTSVDIFIWNKTTLYFGGNNSCTYNAGSSTVDKEVVINGDFSANTPRRHLYGTIDGVSYNTETDTNPINPASVNAELSIFRHSVDTYRGAMKMYYLRLYENGSLIANFVPCKDSNDVIGMYDLVSGQFFTNSGTGTFTAGNPVSDPVEIYTDGTVETIGVYGENLIDLSAVTDGYYYDPQGNYTSLSAARLTDYIPIEAGKDIKIYFKSLSSVSNLNVRINIFNSSKVWQSQEVLSLDPLADGTKTITPADNGYIRVSGNYSGGAIVDWNTASITESSGSATAEMLLKVGDYTDVQEILSGEVTRKVGIKVLDGTEDWQVNPSSNAPFRIAIPDMMNSNTIGLDNIFGICSHFQAVANTVSWVNYNNMVSVIQNSRNVCFRYLSGISNVNTFKQYLADQYAAGTPVIVVYPLATPTTESVAGQTLQVQDGDNTLEITQASLNGLELEAEYSKNA